VPTDVTDGEQARSLVRRAGKFGPVEMLVNCTGAMYYTMMKNVREEEWERTVEVNCKGAPNCVGAVLPGMLERGGGHVVTISSDPGRKIFPVSRSTRRVRSSRRRSPRDCGSRPPAPG